MKSQLKRGEFIKYFLFMVILPYILLTIITTFVIGYFIGTNPNTSPALIGFIFVLVFTIINIFGIGMTIFLSIKRLTDLNKTGFWSLLLLVPFINIIFLLYLIFTKRNDNNIEDENIVIIDNLNNEVITNNDDKLIKEDNNKRPNGIIFILIITGIGIISNISNIIFGKATIAQLGPWLFQGITAKIIILIITIALISLFYTIFNRKKIGRIIGIIYIIYGLFISSINTISIIFSENIKSFYIKDFSNINDLSYTIFITIMLIGVVLLSILNIFILIYLYKNKEYFNK